MVDGLGVGDVGNIVLHDRQNLAQNGIIVVVLTLEKRSNQLLAGPDIVSRGFVYVRESEDLLEEAHRVVTDAVDHWTVRTRDRSCSAHFEHMILITNNEPEILTWPKTM